MIYLLIYFIIAILYYIATDKAIKNAPEDDNNILRIAPSRLISTVIIVQSLFWPLSLIGLIIFMLNNKEA